MTGKITVLNPEGFPPKITGKRLAPSLGELSGKTICIVDGNFDVASGMFMEQLQTWFTEHRPDVKTRLVRWKEPFKDDPAASEEIQRHGDGAILGVGV